MEKQPVFLFEVTQKCGYKCKPCYDHILVAAEQDELKLWEWLIIIESIAEQNGKLIISGGDPFLRNDLIDIVSYAKVLNVDVEIATCGLNLTPQILSELKRVGLDGIIVRLDGITKEENDVFRGVSTYHEAMNALERVREYGLHVSMVINSDTTDENLDTAYAFSKEHKVPLFIAAKPMRGAPALIRSRKWEKVRTGTEEEVLGTVVNPDGKIFYLEGAGLRYSGEVQDKRYRVRADD